MKTSQKILTCGVLAVFLMVSGASAKEKIFLLKKHMTPQKIERFIQKKERKKNARFIKYLPLVNGVVMEIPDRKDADNSDIDDAVDVHAVEENQKMTGSLVSLDDPDAAVVGLVGEPVTMESAVSVRPWGTLDIYDHPYNPSSYMGIYNEAYLDSILSYALSFLVTMSKVKVAVFDTGVDYTHPVLKKKVMAAFNFVGGPSGMDDNGHGTHIAGTIVGQGIGVANGGYIYSAKVLASDSTGTVSTLIDALNWAIQNKVDVVNMSLAFREDSKAVHQAIQAAHDAGITLVAAVGNHSNWEDASTAGDGGAGDGGAGDGGASGDGTWDARYPVMYPAKYPEVIAVSAYDPYGQVAPYANSGPELDVYAPGTAVFSALPKQSYGLYNGTSMATAHVTGVVAILRALDKLDKKQDLYPDDIREILVDTAVDGRVNLVNALGDIW